MNETFLVVEDHPLYRQALIQMLQKIAGENSVLGANSAEAGLRLVDAMQSLRIILLDLNLPGVNGIEAIHAFQRKCPNAAIVIVSSSEDRRDATMAFRAGAIGFVSKAASPDILNDLILRLMSGTATEPEWITSVGSVSTDKSESFTASARQKEIMTLLLKGHSNKEIGLYLGVAEVTVKVHVSAIFRLLGVVNRTQAVIAARRLGFGTELDD